MRWYIAVLAALVLMLQYRIWLSPEGTRAMMQLRDKVAAQTTENQRLAERNRQLAAEVRNLKQDFQAFEERARSQLGLISPNETYYQVVPPSTPAADASTPLRAATH